MDRDVYEIEARVEATHWWFAGRRALLRSRLAGLRVGRGVPVLDVGTGTGSHLRLMKELRFENCTGVDASPEAIRFCAEKGLGEVRQGDVCRLPFEDGAFQLVLATDIIEHVDDDAAALREIHRVLAPGGRALITVPAFPSLWGLQDRVAHHKRRYRMKPLLAAIEGAGLRVRQRFHFNFLLFVPIWLARQVIRVLNVQLKSENEVNNGVLNLLLGAIFRLDVLAAPLLRPPFGVSILVVAEKT